jgi:hypothetical protein
LSADCAPVTKRVACCLAPSSARACRLQMTAVVIDTMVTMTKIAKP